MRSSSLYSFLGIALWVGASLAGCSGDEEGPTTTPKTSAEGESCQSAADCASSLVCVNLVCVESAHPSGGNDGSGGSGKGGSAGSTSKGGSAGTTPAAVLGGEGETCTKRADCEATLHCYNQRCTAGESNGMAGGGGMGPDEPPDVPVLGSVGETCVLPSDCQSGLTCLPGSASGQQGVGVCGTANTGIMPTGKSCAGECETADDCCQLPIAMQSLFTIKSCADIEQLLTAVDCDDPGASAGLCFVQATYCDGCDDKTWACEDSLCRYRPDCSADGLTTEGCPTFSRSGRALPSTCIDNECAAPVPVGCSADDDCATTPVSDDLTDLCSADECTCYDGDAKCYRKCSNDLDCAFGYTCDSTTNLCIAGDGCVDDVFCQQKLGDINAVCDSGTCSVGCSTDLDCNATFIDGGFTKICNQAKHVCEAFGCRTDADCQSSESPVHMFCIETPAAAGSTKVASAVTD